MLLLMTTFAYLNNKSATALHKIEVLSISLCHTQIATTPSALGSDTGSPVSSLIKICLSRGS